MRRLGVVGVALVLLMSSGVAAAAQPETRHLQVSGVGGQSAVLTVPAGGLRIDYPFFSTPRLPGPDGSIGGVLIQDLRTREVVGGLLLQNVPGFSGALELGLGSFEGTELPPGRYRLTLLGTARQTVTLALPRARADRVLRAGGTQRAITRSSYDSSSAAHQWSDVVPLEASRSIVVLGQGAGGELQQASLDQACFRPAADADALCLQPDVSSSSASPGAGSSASWLTMVFMGDSTKPGDYRHSGRSVSVSATGVAAHSSVVIDVPR